MFKFGKKDNNPAEAGVPVENAKPKEKTPEEPGVEVVTPPEESAKKNTSIEAAAADALAEEGIHTMPSRYLQQAKSGDNTSNRTKILAVAALGIFIIGIIIVTISFFTDEPKGRHVVETDITPRPDGRVNTPVATSTPDKETPPKTSTTSTSTLDSSDDPKLDTAAGRDEGRMKIVGDVQVALEDYASESGSFPPALGYLVGDFLLEFPIDPSNTEGSFEYIQVQDGKSYVFLFELEVGITSPLIRFKPGKYQLTPEGVTIANDNQGGGAKPDIPAGNDFDEDSLTNIEEELYNTDPEKVDTDGDGFGDGLELINLFNPAGNDQLITSGTVQIYQNPVHDYRLFYPAIWLARPVDTSLDVVLFVSEISESVEVLTQANPSGISPLELYLSQSPGVNTSLVQSVSYGDVSGVKSVDGSTVYLAGENKIYIISYTGDVEGGQPNFQTTFNIMLKSFSLQ